MNRLEMIVCIFTLFVSCSKIPSHENDSSAEKEHASSFCTLRVGYDPDEPFAYTDAQGNARGLDIELMEAMSELAECKLTYIRNKQWSGLVGDLELGRIDVLPAATPTLDRKKFAFFSTPVREEIQVLFIRAGEYERWRGVSFDEGVKKLHLRIGVTNGYRYNNMIEELRQSGEVSAQFVAAESTADNFVNLLDNEVDAVLEDTYVASALIRREKWQASIYRLGLSFPGHSVGLMFSRLTVTEQIVTRFDRALVTLKSNGRYNKIFDHYRDLVIEP